MESLLLGALSYYGNSKIEQNKDSSLNRNNYDSNLENKMNIIENKQAKQINNPEFFQQFDSLTFDNLSKPTSENQSYMTRSGFNNFLQRDLDFKNGYSEFQNTDMHYGVVTKENFVHNNMYPHTSKRDTLINLNSNNRKYENLSGNNTTWKHKNELEAFFDPVKGMSNVYGLPAVSGELGNRYIASFRNNNGNLPFQTEQRVLPGLDGKVSAPYPVTRIDPRNIDELRSEINKKVTYLNKPLEVIKKGDIRASEGKITAFKLPSYREISFDDLVANKHDVEGPKQTGKFVHTETARGTNDINYTGGSYDPNRGTSIDPEATYFSEPKRENYENDFTHAINAVNTRPVFTNAESYTNYETERDTTTYELFTSGAHDNNQASYYIDNNYVAKPTMKQNNIIQDRNLGINGPSESKTYMLSNDFIINSTNRQTTNYDDVNNAAPQYKNPNLLYTDKAKQTIKETTNYDDVNNAAPQYKNPNLLYTDKAKQTIKETTNYDDVNNAAPQYKNPNLLYTDIARQTIKETTNYDDVNNAAPQYKNPNLLYTDTARQTIKETTNYDNVNNAAPQYKNPNLLYVDKAKPTIKETTVINSIITNAAPTTTGNIIRNNDMARPTIKESTSSGYNGNPNYQISSYVNNEDEARQTIRETTEDNNYIGIIGGDNNKETYTNYEDKAKDTIKQTTLFETPIQNVIANVTQAYAKNDEEARPTIKETLLHPAPGGRMYDNNQANYKDIDVARATIKETILITDYVGTATHNVDSLRVEDAERNMTIRDKRQQTALGGRISNAKSDQIRGNINPDTVKFQNKRTLLEGYISVPGISTNYSVTPFERTAISRKTDLNSNNFYRIDPLFIDTLKENPLVNDLMHQKNTDFNTGN
jgi:hypothetical protein